MSRHKITASRSGFTNGMDWEASYEVTFTHRRGALPDHTDPGYPDAIEAVDIKPEYGSLDAREKAEALDWAQSWLDDDGFEAAMEVVLSDDEAAREYAAELRIDR